MKHKIMLKTQKGLKHGHVRLEQVCFMEITVYILKAKSNFTLVLYIHVLGIGKWYFKCV